MNEETPAGSRYFSHLCLHFSSEPFIIFSPYILLNLPSFQFNPSPACPPPACITQSVYWYVLLRTPADELGFSLGLICFLE